VGLGNPGKKYVDTRHNVGFDMIMSISAYYGIKVKKLKCKAIVGEGKIGNANVILAMPQTYMNLSGESVKGLIQYYKVKPENLIVISDDISLPVGKIRIRAKGSAGGHNGLKNIIYHLETDEFPRVKIGVGGPAGDVADYVLDTFPKSDIKILTETAKEMPEIINTIISEGIEKAMNKYN
jgi:PTH1 family peptidyl-tRNA hydrolase